jgi:hypothetical protein
MRTISAALEDACAKGNGEPYATLAFGGFGGSFDVIEYELKRDSFTCVLDRQVNDLNDLSQDAPTYQFGFSRGIRNVGTISFIGHVHKMTANHKHTLIEGEAYQSKTNISGLVPSTNTFAQIISGFTAIELLPTPTLPWYDYQFYEAGSAALTGVLHNLVSVLNLKYRVTAFPRGTDGEIGIGGGATDTLTADWDMKEILRVANDDAVTDHPTLKTFKIPGHSPSIFDQPQYNYVWYKDGGTKKSLLNSTQLPYWHLGYINSNTLPGVLLTKADRLICEWTQRPNLAVEMGDVAWGTRSWNGTHFSFHQYAYGYIEFEERFKKRDGIWKTTYRIVQ